MPTILTKILMILMRNYFSYCWQGKKISTAFSSWSSLLKVIIQGSCTNFVQYISKQLANLQIIQDLMLMILKHVHIACHTVISFGNKHESLWANIGNDRISASNEVKLLWANLESHRGLKFDLHLLKTCGTANMKLTIIRIRMLKFLNYEKRREYLLNQILICILLSTCGINVSWRPN